MGIADVMAATAKAVADAAAKAKADASKAKASTPSTSTSKPSTFTPPKPTSPAVTTINEILSYSGAKPISDVKPEPETGRIGLTEVATPSSGRIGLTEVATYPGQVIPEKPKQPSPLDIIGATINIIKDPQLQNEKIGRSLAPILNPEQVQLAYNVYSGTGESPAVIYERNYQAYKTLIEKKDVGGIGLRVAGSPLALVGSSYVLGAGLGGLAATKVGQTAAFTIGKTPITPSLALNTATGVYFTTETAKSGYNAYKSGNIKEWVGMTGASLPLVFTPFKAGYTKASGYVQRTGAMSTVTDPLKRTQQEALYDMMKTNEKLHEPYLEQKPYDITNVKKIPSLEETEQFFKSPLSQTIRKPAIGGSTAMDIQMGEFFRKGGYPERILNIAEERQLASGVPKELRTSGGPIDVDILLGGKLTTEKTAEIWGERLDTHVHISKPNEPLFGGYSSKPFTKSMVSFTDEPIKVKTLSVREQFLRYGVSALPSAEKQTAYRSFKDIPGLFDIYDVLRFQKGGGKLSEAMDRYMYPERYQSPRVRLGERALKRIGGAAEPKWIERYKGSYIEPVYPKSSYYGGYPFLMNSKMLYQPYGGYKKSSYPILPLKDVDYQPKKSYEPTKISTSVIPYKTEYISKPKETVVNIPYDTPDTDLPYPTHYPNAPLEPPSVPYIPAKQPPSIPYTPKTTTHKEPPYTPKPRRPYFPIITPPYIPTKQPPYKSPPYKPPTITSPPNRPEYPISEEDIKIKKLSDKKAFFREKYKFRKAKYAKNPFDIKISKVKI